MNPELQSLYSMIEPFIPNSSGSEQELLMTGVRGNRNFIKNLLELNMIFGRFENPIKDVTTLEEYYDPKLKELLDGYKSDKAAAHNYDYLYSFILKDKENIKSVLEIGLGTNDSKFMSSMGDDGRPGSSIRAFRDYLPNAQIYGADVDRKILFEEERIKTFFVDQLRVSTVEELFKNMPVDMDLIIDDGLHCPEANITIMSFALNHIKPGGWFIVEDIPDRSINLWKLIMTMIPNFYTCTIYKAEKGNLFAVNRIS